MIQTKKHFLSHLDKFWFYTGFIFTVFCLVIYFISPWWWLKAVSVYYLSLGFIYSVIELIISNFGRGWRDSNGNLYTNPHSGICSFALAQIIVLLIYFLIIIRIGIF